MGTGRFNAGGNPTIDQHPIQGGVEILPVTSCYENRDKLLPDGPLGSYADLTFFTLLHAVCQGYITEISLTTKAWEKAVQNVINIFTCMKHNS